MAVLCTNPILDELKSKKKRDPALRAIFKEIVYEAQFGKKDGISVGQCITSQRRLSDLTGFGRSIVRTRIDWLVELGLIEQKIYKGKGPKWAQSKNDKFTLIQLSQAVISTAYKNIFKVSPAYPSNLAQPKNRNNEVKSNGSDEMGQKVSPAYPSNLAQPPQSVPHTVLQQRYYKKTSSSKEKGVAEAPLAHDDDVLQFLKLWNTHCGELPKVTHASSALSSNIKARWNELPEEAHWIQVISRLARSDLANKRITSDRFPNGWTAGLSWLVKNDGNHYEVLTDKHESPTLDRLERMAALQKQIEMEAAEREATSEKKRLEYEAYMVANKDRLEREAQGAEAAEKEIKARGTRMLRSLRGAVRAGRQI